MTAQFICPVCGAKSANPNDLKYGYCGRCHAFTGRYNSRQVVEDVFAVAVPHPLLDEPHDVIAEQLRRLAESTATAQYSPGNAPALIEFEAMDWLITDDPEQVETFQPAHDCAQCAEGNERARAFLHDNPGVKIALANLRYVEVWP